MSIQQFLLALRARFRVFALILAATAAAAVTASLLLPKTYKATASLLVDAKDEQSLSNSLRPLILPQERLSYLQTQMDIISSRKVGRKAVRELGLAQDAAMQAAFAKADHGAGSIEDWLVDGLHRDLKVETSQSNVIQVGFSSADPRFAASVANAFARAYADTMLELRIEPTREAAAWFDEQLKSLRANLEQAQARLTDYQRRKGIVATDEHLDVDSARLSELSTELVNAQARTFDATARARQAREFMAAGGSPDDVPEVLSNPFIQKLKSDLMGGEAKLQEISSQLGVKHPRYQRQLSENESLRGKLVSEMRRVVAGLESTVRQGRAREAELNAALDAQRERVLERKASRNEAGVLARDVENAQRAYDLALQRFTASKVDSRANQADVAILSPAVVPDSPARPRLLLNALLSVVVGTMLGLGAVILLELSDRRVRLPADFMLGQEAPLLAVLGPWPGTTERLLTGPE
jgi:succinoglycan biosynthesis transport protein ExoP